MISDVKVALVHELRTQHALCQKKDGIEYNEVSELWDNEAHKMVAKFVEEFPDATYPLALAHERHFKNRVAKLNEAFPPDDREHGWVRLIRR